MPFIERGTYVRDTRQPQLKVEHVIFSLQIFSDLRILRNVTEPIESRIDRSHVPSTSQAQHELRINTFK